MGEYVRDFTLVLDDGCHRCTKVSYERNHCEECNHHNNCSPLFLFLTLFLLICCLLIIVYC
ncbi:hypothetical protein EVA_09928 [gut metagenome]|uniref:Uncharacterized protein n=1 Tax=gut metagenome TaxID=749906 RepID=J9GPQ4_9ZZZZ